MSIAIKKTDWPGILSSHRESITTFHFGESESEIIEKVNLARFIFAEAESAVEGIQSARYHVHFEDRAKVAREIFLLQGDLASFSSAIKIHTWIVKLNASISMLSAAKKALDKKPSDLSSERSITIYHRAQAVEVEYRAAIDLRSDERLCGRSTLLAVRLQEVRLRLGI